MIKVETNSKGVECEISGKSLDVKKGGYCLLRGIRILPFMTKEILHILVERVYED